jgi:hypothetical protein
MMLKLARGIALLVMGSALLAMAQTAPQTTYTPKFPGDPAHSDAEAAALGYMRTVGTAEKLYKRKHGEYAPTLAGLVGSGSFTRRMTNLDRGDYRVDFHGTTKEYTLSLVPRQFDADRRAFYMDESGVIRAEEDKPATGSSPSVKGR